MSDYPDGEGHKQKVYLTPEWAALKGIDKNFIAFDTGVTFGLTALGSYTVPAGKTLYITQLSFAVFASAIANADLNQMATAYLLVLPFTNLVFLGGNGGNSITFSKPHVITEGLTLRYVLLAQANHAMDIYLTVSGYEI